MSLIASSPLCLTLFAAANGGKATQQFTFANGSDFTAHWQQLGNFQPVSSPEDVQHFALCECDPNQPFSRAAIREVSGIVLDIAETPDAPESLQSVLHELDLLHVAYVRFDASTEKIRWRLVVPLDEPVSPEDFEAHRLPLALAKKLQAVIDPACLKVDRLYPLPCYPQASLKSGRVDFPAIFGISGSRLLSLTDLEPVSDDEIDAYLPRRALGRPAPKPAQHPLFAEMDRYVSEHWGGVAPIFAEGCCFFYDGIIWKARSMDALRQHLLVDIFQEQRSPGQVQQFVQAMRLRYHRDRFPLAAGLGCHGGYHDPRAFRIALSNGTVAPSEGRLVDNEPENFLRSQLPFRFRPMADCPRWRQFLQEVFAPDEDRKQKIQFLQEMIGYLLIPSTEYHVQFWLVGEGSNGKSVILQVIQWLLGSENVSNVPLHSLGQKFYLAQLVGKLANVSDEIAAGIQLNDAVLKSVVSGGTLQAERKGEQPFEFTPYARLVASTNVLPRTADQSHGFFRRVKILPFKRIFAEHEQDRSLPQTLHGELSGIFNWALDGLRRLQRRGHFTKVPSSELAQAQYRDSLDPARAFIRTQLQMRTPDKPRIRTQTGIVYAAFEAYCQANGYATIASSSFGKVMAARGLGAEQSNGRNYYPVQLLDPDEEVC